MKMKKRFVKLITVLFLACAILSGCGSKNQYVDYDVADEAATEDRGYDDAGFGGKMTEKMDMNGAAKEESMANESKETEENAIKNGRKIIKTYYINLETKEFEKTNTAIDDKVQAVGGYVQNSHINGKSMYEEYDSNRYSNFTLRIPTAKVDDFINQLGDVGNVRDSSQDAQEITAQYFDTEAHLKTLKVQEERLLALLEKSGELSDIIEIERELADVRYQIEGLTGSLRKWDDLIAYSTVTIEVREVKELTVETPEDFLGQIREGFKNSLYSVYKLGKNIIYTLIVSIPYLVILAVILFIVIRIKRKNSKGNGGFKFKKKNNENNNKE